MIKLVVILSLLFSFLIPPLLFVGSEFASHPRRARRSEAKRLYPFIAAATAGHCSPSMQTPNRLAKASPARADPCPAFHSIQRHRIEPDFMYLSALALKEHIGKWQPKI